MSIHVVRDNFSAHTFGAWYVHDVCANVFEIINQTVILSVCKNSAFNLLNLSNELLQ